MRFRPSAPNNTGPSRRQARLLRSLAACAVAGALAACASAPPPEPFEELASAEELYQEGLAQLAEESMFDFIMPDDHAEAIETFQEIIDNYPYSDQAVLAELAIADAYFDAEKYTEAISYYNEFVDLHPEHEQVPYAMFRTARSYYERSREAGRDQTDTSDAITQLERLMQRHPHSPYAAEAEEVWRELRTRLAQHNMQVGDYYFDHEEYPSAAERYRGLLAKYPGLGLDAEALLRLGMCYTRMNRSEEAEEIFQVILENYEGSEVAKTAADLVPAAN